jgi:hypothetical protein
MARHEIHIRWSDVESKHAWMRALAQLLDRVKPHLDNQADREHFALVNDRLDQEFKEEGIKRPTGAKSPSQ